MIPEDAPAIKRHLDALTSIFGRKPLNEVAVTAWFQHLREYPIEVVTWAMGEWPAIHDHFPAISQMRKVVGEEHARRCHARDRRLNAVGEDALTKCAQQSEIAKREFARARAIWGSPKPHPMTWAQRLRDRERCGEVLTPMQAKLWRDALDRYPHAMADAHPAKESDDQREARIEREAIQAEAAMA